MGDIAILDCGAQYAKVIDRRVRELGITSDLIPVGTPVKKLAQYKAFIISGGPDSVYADGAPQCDPELFSLGKPILGICYGMQLIAQYLGGKVGKQQVKEYGETFITVSPDSKLFAGMQHEQQVLMSHGDSVLEPPQGFTVTARSGGIIAAVEHKNIVGVQFHPEVDLTPNGKAMLQHFLYDIAGLEPSRSISSSIAHSVNEIRKVVRDANVAVLVSGGVDSAVTAALLLRALKPEQVFAIHIDHGFMRKNESQQVMLALQGLGLQHARLVNASEMFAGATTLIDGRQTQKLSDTTHPEEKRKIIGDTFIRLADAELSKIPGKVFLAQGTLRPDLIESASELVSAAAATIKTHHNDSALVREKRRQGMIIETNKDWHKDEVRQVARKLGLPAAIAERQPFPGPGLAIRVVCGTRTVPSTVSAQVREVAARYGFDAAVLPVQSVGVQGDGRTYAHVAVLDGEFSWNKLKAAASEIPRVVHDINRVCYLLRGDITSITEVETRLTATVLDTLREADAIARRLAGDAEVAQMPVVLLPVSLGKGRTLVLRPFVTNDFMTGRAAVIDEEISYQCLQDICDNVMQLEGIGAVLYDLTSKPPGTTEWE